MTLRGAPAAALVVAVAVAVGIFVALPIGAMLVESVMVRGPMPVERLRTITADALQLLPEESRASALERWWAGATPQERLATLGAAFRRQGANVTWDAKRSFDDQLRGAERAVAALPDDQRRAIEADLPLVNAALHKRVALAFQVRERVAKDEFERLRSGTETRLGIDHYVAFWRDPHLRRAFWNSLQIAAVASLLAVSVAFALAYAVNRGGVHSPNVVRALVLLPLVSPPVMIAFAMLMLFGRRGLVTDTLLDQGLGLIDADVQNIYGLAGVVIAQVLAFAPAAFVVIDNVLVKQDGRLEEAAASQGAGPWRILRHVTLPLALPGLRRALILVFMLSLTDFGNPLILGRDVPVIAGIIYEEITAFRNTPLASALCVWLLAPCLLVFLLLELVGRRARYDSGASVAAPELPLPKSWRAALSAHAVLVCGLVAALYLTVAAGAFTTVWGVDWTPTLGYFSAEGVNTGHGGSGYGSSDRGLSKVWESAQVAAVAALIGGPLAVLVAYVVERLRPPGAEALAFVVLLPAVLPGIVFGVGYIVVFNDPFGIKELAITGTRSILVLNILFGNLFVGVLAARAALQRIDVAVEEAAESLGAGLWRRLALVVAPLLTHALLLGALYVFVDGMTTLSSVIFLVSGEHKLASVAVFNHASSGEYGYAAAKSVAIMAFAIAAMAAIRWYERRPSQALRPA